MRFLLPICSALSLIAAGPACAADAGKPSNSAAPKEKMICKRFIRVGSLVDGYKTCKTKKEWDREHDNLQQLSITDSCRNRGSGQGCDK
jgi:hypothetical protein